MPLNKQIKDLEFKVCKKKNMSSSINFSQKV